jgi:hypothetical protein
MLPVATGGHDCTSHFVPALLPPQRKTANTRLAAMAKFEFSRRTGLLGQDAIHFSVMIVSLCS